MLIMFAICNKPNKGVHSIIVLWRWYNDLDALVLWSKMHMLHKWLMFRANSVIQIVDLHYNIKINDEASANPCQAELPTELKLFFWENYCVHFDTRKVEHEISLIQDELNFSLKTVTIQYRMYIYILCHRGVELWCICCQIKQCLSKIINIMWADH